jgi:hypothetical protein
MKRTIQHSTLPIQHYPMKRSFFFCAVMLWLASYVLWSQPARRPTTTTSRSTTTTNTNSTSTINRGIPTNRGTTTNRTTTARQTTTSQIANDPPAGSARIGTVRATTPASRVRQPTRTGTARGVAAPRTGTAAAPRPVAQVPRTQIDYCTLCITTLATIEHPLVSGSLARHAALGGGGYGIGGQFLTYGANPFLIDSYSIFYNPAYADRYRDAIFVNAGSISGASSQPLSNFGGPSVGAVFALSPRVTLGGIVSFESFPGISNVNTDIASAIALNSILGLGYTGFAANPNFTLIRARNAAHLQASYNASPEGKGGTILAAGVSYTSTSLSPLTVNPRPQPAANLTQIGINAGFLLTTASLSMLDISATILLPRVSIPFPNSTNGSAVYSSTIIGINARYIARISKEFTLIPMANIYAVSSGSPYFGNMNSFDGGIGFNYVVGPLFFVGGISVSTGGGGNLPSQSVPGAGPTSQELILPRWNIGAEYRIIEWFKIRAGYAGYSSTSRSNDVVVPSYFNYGLSQGVSLGIGLEFGKFTLDLTTDTRTLQRGLGNIGSGEPTFGFVSANFRF